MQHEKKAEKRKNDQDGDDKNGEEKRGQVYKIFENIKDKKKKVSLDDEKGEVVTAKEREDDIKNNHNKAGILKCFMIIQFDIWNLVEFI